VTRSATTTTAAARRLPDPRHTALPVVLLVIALLELASGQAAVAVSLNPEPVLAAAALPLVLAQTVPLAWRGQAPGTVLGVTGAVFLVGQLGGAPPTSATLGASFALGGVAVHGTRRVLVRAVAVSATVLTVTTVVAWYTFQMGARVPVAAFALVPVALLVVPLAVGLHVRTRDARPAALPATPPGPAPARAGALASLTPREREVLDLLARGRSNAEIAAELFVGRETVKSHVSRILVKLGARDRAEVIVLVHGTGHRDTTA